jgi:hypothetical protein
MECRVDTLRGQGQPNEVELILRATMQYRRTARPEVAACRQVAVDPLNARERWEVSAAPVLVQSGTGGQLRFDRPDAVDQPRKIERDGEWVMYRGEAGGTRHLPADAIPSSEGRSRCASEMTGTGSRNKETQSIPQTPRPPPVGAQAVTMKRSQSSDAGTGRENR